MSDCELSPMIKADVRHDITLPYNDYICPSTVQYLRGPDTNFGAFVVSDGCYALFLVFCALRSGSTVEARKEQTTDGCKRWWRATTVRVLQLYGDVVALTIFTDDKLELQPAVPSVNSAL